MRDPDPPDPAGHGAKGDDAYAVIPLARDDAAVQAEQLERARKLGRRLRVEVSIDTTGWLRTEIEIIVHKEPDGAVRPIKVRVGVHADDAAILKGGGVIAACERYNGALRRLRQLAERLATLVREGHTHMAAGSSLAYAHRELERLDELIASRQQATIGHNTVSLATLIRETEFFARCDAQLAPIVLAALTTRPKAPRDPLAAATLGWLNHRSAQRRS